ncbi:hypothetical protein AGMMS50229_20980 [Campylobacterota bacterium]|nr:hypothetical protein AGMMS50229_20980 [Campylobacterota bacterium]
MRHLVNCFECGMQTVPKRFAEFGPGDSLGVGLCGVLAGSDKYYAFDSIAHANNRQNIAVLHKLVAFFRAKIPFNNQPFPSHILTDDLLKRSLADTRIETIVRMLENGETTSGDLTIQYVAPWENYNGDYPMVDYALSQAVLEHIYDLEYLYATLAQITISSGFLSHQIDFRSHGETFEWNGHWSINDRKWEKIKAIQTYSINREPVSTHIKLFSKHGFTVLRQQNSAAAAPSISREKLTDRFSQMSDEDFTASGSFIVARKK